MRIVATDGEKASRGALYTNGGSMRKGGRKLLRQNIGYCAGRGCETRLCDHLTVRETFELISGLRGLTRNAITIASVCELMEALRLDEHKHKLIRHLSAGVKRTLSAALAFVGRPPLVILDEVGSFNDA